MVYADDGRVSIALERLLRAQLLQVLYSIRSERQLVEQIQYNPLSRCFVDLSIDEGVGPLDVHQEPGPAAGT